MDHYAHVCGNRISTDVRAFCFSNVLGWKEGPNAGKPESAEDSLSHQQPAARSCLPAAPSLHSARFSATMASAGAWGAVSRPCSRPALGGYTRLAPPSFHTALRVPARVLPRQSVCLCTLLPLFPLAPAPAPSSLSSPSQRLALLGGCV